MDTGDTGAVGPAGTEADPAGADCDQVGRSTTSNKNCDKHTSDKNYSSQSDRDIGDYYCVKPENKVGLQKLRNSSEITEIFFSL